MSETQQKDCQKFRRESIKQERGALPCSMIALKSLESGAVLL